LSQRGGTADDEAATVGPPGLRTLDAIHLAAAQLRALVTCDTRLADAGESLGIAVASPR
jgi:hypothetical protein